LHVFVSSADGGSHTEYLVVDDGATARPVFGSPDSLGNILSFSVSPNGQFAAVETNPNTRESVYDGFITNAKPVIVTTSIVGLATGEVVRSFPGFGVDW